MLVVGLGVHIIYLREHLGARVAVLLLELECHENF